VAGYHFIDWKTNHAWIIYLQNWMSTAGDIEYQAQKNTTINHSTHIHWRIARQCRDALAFG